MSDTIQFREVDYNKIAYHLRRYSYQLNLYADNIPTDLPGGLEQMATRLDNARSAAKLMADLAYKLNGRVDAARSTLFACEDALRRDAEGYDGFKDIKELFHGIIGGISAAADTVINMIDKYVDFCENEHEDGECVEYAAKIAKTIHDTVETYDDGGNFWLESLKNFKPKEIKEFSEMIKEGIIGKNSIGTFLKYLTSGISATQDNWGDMADSTISADRGVIQIVTQALSNAAIGAGVTAGIKALMALGAYTGKAILITVLAAGALWSIDTLWKGLIGNGDSLAQSIGKGIGQVYDWGKEAAEAIGDTVESVWCNAVDALCPWIG